jgi:outer membrane lipoprotein SlyB
MKIRTMGLGLVAAVCLGAAACTPTSPASRAAINHEMGCMAGGVAGALIGSFIGNQFGGGAGRDILRTAGGIAGAAEGRALSCG